MKKVILLSFLTLAAFVFNAKAQNLYVGEYNIRNVNEKVSRNCIRSA